MSNSLPPSLVKAIKGDYRIPIKLIFIETWQQLFKMPKTFWQGFGLVLLVLLGTTTFMGLLLRWYDMEILHFFQNLQAQLSNLHTLHVLNSPKAPPKHFQTIRAELPALYTLHGLKALPSHFVKAAIEILRFLLTVSLAFLALNHLRNQTTKVTITFAFLKNWRCLLFIGVVFYLLRVVIYEGLFFVFRAMHLYPLLPQDLNKPIIALAYYGHIFLAIFLYTYLMIVAFMSSLLILDQNMSFKKSLCVAFKSINRPPLKNIVLLFLASWAYLGAWTDSYSLIFTIGNGFGLFAAYLFFLPGMIMAILFILYKKMASQINLSRMKKITLIALKMILGLVVLELFFSGMGLTWLLPVIALLIAIQYQHIFLDKSLSYV